MRSVLDLPYGSHPLQKLDLHLPDENGAFPVFVYFHGGGFEKGDKSRHEILMRHLTSLGIAVANANYRMYPEAKFPNFIEDGAAAVAWVTRHFSDYGTKKSLYVGGSSAGGHLSALLCFDKRYLAAHGLSPLEIDGFFHDAGQMTCHFNVLKERGLDPKRILVDERAPLFYVGLEEELSPMHFVVSDQDMKNRYEETLLMISALERFGHKSPKVTLEVMHGTHCAYVHALDGDGKSVFGKMVASFILNQERKKGT